jgi:pyruvate dehydrogenase E2 component (dihydrolipoyllysine-residue acetyltransferase)
MATQVILPALGMSQETGTIVQWLKSEGERVTKGEPIAEIETDKATVELEAPASGTLSNVTALAGAEIPVGQVIATILAAGEIAREQAPAVLPAQDGNRPQKVADINGRRNIAASPLASRIASEHQLDLNQIQPAGRKIQKADVLTYLQEQTTKLAAPQQTRQARLLPASPKARRLAMEQGKDIAAIQGSGPLGAVLAADVLVETATLSGGDTLSGGQVIMARAPEIDAAPTPEGTGVDSTAATHGLAVSTVWRIMAERTTQSWTSVPHFYLGREVNASRLLAWRTQVKKRGAANVTFTDLLVKVVAAALREHPRLNASCKGGTITLNNEVHVGVAVATDDGLVVPVIHNADNLNVRAIAEQRQELVGRAQANRLRPEDIRDGTFTISNLGMYGVDVFNAIINPPQVAILAVGRMIERVIPVDGQPSIQPMMALTLSCDHRAVDGARGAQFLATVADGIEEPLGLIS